MQIAKCKLQKEEDLGKSVQPTLSRIPSANLQFAFCILQFAIPSVLLISLTGFLFFYRLADRDLWSSHEARAAQDAQTMLLDGSWGLPRLFDRHWDFQKPPLYYWLVAEAALLFGSGTVDAWAVRLPAALSGMAGVFLVYWLLALRGRRQAGVIAAAMLATMLHYTWLGRTGRIDMPLAASVVLALGGYYLGYCRDQDGGRWKWKWQLLGYLGLAAGIMFKGPIALVLAGTVVILHQFLEKRIPAPWQGRAWIAWVRSHGLWWGIPLVAGLTLPWFLWANQASNGEFSRVFFWHHNVERGLGEGDLAARPWWFYGPHLFLDLLPWSLLLPAAGWMFLSRPGWRFDREARFGLVWFAGITVLLSCFRFKRADYLLPAYPGAALFMAGVAERFYRSSYRQRGLKVAFGMVCSLCALAWWGYTGYVLPAYEPALEWRSFAAEVRRRAPCPQLILFFRTEAHALAFHVGRPIDTILEWENLDAWVGRPEVYHVLMPAPEAAEWRRHLKSGRLEEVTRVKRPETQTWFDRLIGHTEITGTLHAQPLVLMRSYPQAPD